MAMSHLHKLHENRRLVEFVLDVPEDRLEREVFQTQVLPDGFGHQGNFIVAAVADVQRPYQNVSGVDDAR